MGRLAELVLGTVQLGVSYGIANRIGKPPRRQAVALIARALEAGVSTIDTARAYGDSEACIGEALAGDSRVCVITKLSPLADLAANASRASVRAGVDASIEASLGALRRSRLDCLLLHRASHLHDFGGAVWERLLERLDDGTIGKLGVSAQSPAEALMALESMDVRHIQLPFNLLDWRWHQAGVPERIRTRPDLCIHVRSVFLQGLLAANDPLLWPAVAGVESGRLTAALASLARDLDRIGTADLALSYDRAQDWIDGVVLGMETRAQLDDNLALFARTPLRPAEVAMVQARVPQVPADLLDPSRWKARTHA